MTKVNTPLSERYLFECASCGYPRQMFGTEQEVRAEAERMGWEIRRVETNPNSVQFGDRVTEEKTYCPHCKLLVKEAS